MPEDQVIADNVISFKKMNQVTNPVPFEVISDDITGQIPGDYPVTIEAMKPFWQYLEFALDWFVGFRCTRDWGIGQFLQ